MFFIVLEWMLGNRNEVKFVVIKVDGIMVCLLIKSFVEL